MLFREEKLSQLLPNSNFNFSNSPISPKYTFNIQIFVHDKFVPDYFTQGQVRVQKSLWELLE